MFILIINDDILLTILSHRRKPTVDHSTYHSLVDWQRKWRSHESFIL